MTPSGFGAFNLIDVRRAALPPKHSKPPVVFVFARILMVRSMANSISQALIFRAGAMLAKLAWTSATCVSRANVLWLGG